MSLPRMRTAAGVLDAIRADDPDTQVSLHLIRMIIKSGDVPVVRAGKRLLVNVDDITAYLLRGSEWDAPAQNGIRRVAAR